MITHFHNDEKAEKILSDLKAGKEENPVSPEWESKLIEKSFTEAKILENDVYTHIDTLKRYRNLSAHPVLNSMDILYKPNKELAESMNINILEGLLTKPPTLTKTNENFQCYHGYNGDRNKVLLEPAKKLMPEVNFEETYGNLF